MTTYRPGETIRTPTKAQTVRTTEAVVRAVDEEARFEIATKIHHVGRHGIPSGYLVGCRGPLCRLAHSDYQADRRGVEREAPRWMPDAVAEARLREWVAHLDGRGPEPETPQKGPKKHP